MSAAPGDSSVSGPPVASPQQPSELTPAHTAAAGTTTQSAVTPEPTHAAPVSAPLSPTSQEGEGDLQNVLHLEPDTGDNSDNDSAFDANSSSSTSLASSILNYEYWNGRRYHGFRQGAYVLPNDEQEQDRLDLLHHIFLLILDGKLYDAPIPPAPRRVLDIGTGTGIWAIDFADEQPGAEVIGTDLSPIQPTWVPPNVKFYVDDAEAEWLYNPDERFDFIHCRTLAGSIGDWDKLVRQTYTHLQPGGWVEFQEPLALYESDDGTLQQAESILQWQAMCDTAAAYLQKDCQAGQTLKQRLIDAGYVDVHEKTVKVPIGPWPKDPKMKEIGRYQREHMAMGMEPYTLGLAGKVLGWSDPECRVLIAKTVSDVRNRALHMYIRFIFVHGRKPESAVH